MNRVLRNRGAAGARVRRSTHSWASALKVAVSLGLLVAADAGTATSGGTGGTGGNPAPPPAFTSEIIGRIGGLTQPTRIAISSEGEVYIADTARGIVAIHDRQGQRVGTLTGFQQPLGVALSQSRKQRLTCSGWSTLTTDFTYVGDQLEGSVVVFRNGRHQHKLGSGPGEFLKPNGIAATSDQIVYVVDSDASQIKVYGAKGAWLNSFGSAGSGDGQLDFPTDVVLDEATGEVYVSDFGNQRIAVFDLDGAWLRNLAPPANEQGDPTFFRIAGLGFSSIGNLYVVDSALGSVTIITPAGALVDIIGSQFGTYWTGDLNVPIDAASNENFLYVTSSQDRLVNIFGVIQ